MSDQAVIEETCGSCSAAIRAGSLFCYSCGASLASAPIAAVGNVVSAVAGNGTFAEGTDPGERPVPKPDSFEPMQAEPQPIRAKTAAEIQRRTSFRPPAVVKISWQQRLDGFAFVGISIVFAVLVLLVVAIAFYLK